MKQEIINLINDEINIATRNQTDANMADSNYWYIQGLTKAKIIVSRVGLPVKPANGGQVIRIFKDKLGNIYVKTGRDTGFMARISDGTRHDGTTIGSFEFVKEVEC